MNDDVGEGEAAAGAAALDVEAGATAEAGAESFGAAEQKQGSARGRLAAAVLAVGKGNNPAPPWRGALRQTASMFVREALCGGAGAPRGSRRPRGPPYPQNGRVRCCEGVLPRSGPRRSAAVRRRK